MTVNFYRSPIKLLLFLFFCSSPGCELDVDLNTQTDGGDDTTPLSDTDSVDVSDSDTESSENDSESEEDIEPPSPAEPCAPEPEGELEWEIEVNQVTGTVIPDLGLPPPQSVFAGDLANDGS